MITTIIIRIFVIMIATALLIFVIFRRDMLPRDLRDEPLASMAKTGRSRLQQGVFSNHSIFYATVTATMTVMFSLLVFCCW